MLAKKLDACFVAIAAVYAGFAPTAAAAAHPATGASTAQLTDTGWQ